MKINASGINKEVRNMSSLGNTRRDFLKAAAVGAATLAEIPGETKWLLASY